MRSRLRSSGGDLLRVRLAQVDEDAELVLREVERDVDLARPADVGPRAGAAGGTVTGRAPAISR